MSLSYSESLSHYPHKGKVGAIELREDDEQFRKKLDELEEMIRQSKHTVVITGAGISTDAGIPDFRGPNGVWTLEKRGEKPTFNVGFEEAQATLTHRALCVLEEKNLIQFVISQNIDGLHHRSGFPLEKLAELHGNVFAEECERCGTTILHEKCVGSFCRKRTGNVCNSLKGRNQKLRCRGKLRDNVLDWEDALPEPALKRSEENCAKADLCLCLGTSLQIRPCRDLPKKTKKNDGRIVIVNLQKTSLDSIASLVIHERCDKVMKNLLERLNLSVDPPTLTEKRKNFFIFFDTLTEEQKSIIEEKFCKRMNGISMKIDQFDENVRSKTHNFIFLEVSSRSNLEVLKKCSDDRLFFVRFENQTIEEENSQIFWSLTILQNSTISIDEQIESFLNEIQ